MDAAGLYAGHVGHHHRRRSGHGNDEPYHAEEEKTRQRDEFQHQRMPGRKVPHRAKRHQKHDGGNAGNNHQTISMVRCRTWRDRQCARSARSLHSRLALSSQTRDVLPPARQNVSHDAITADIAHLMLIDLLMRSKSAKGP